jgi:hypothetical protein
VEARKVEDGGLFHLRSDLNSRTAPAGSIWEWLIRLSVAAGANG